MIALVTVMLLAAGGNEKAQQAEALFQRARALLKADQPAEACPMFEKSHTLDPALGTLMNLADCEERTNHLVSAYVHFNDAAAWAERTHESQRAGIAQQRASALKPRLAWMALSTAAPVRGLTVKVNAFSVELGATAQSVPVDPGEALVIASADGFQRLVSRVRVPPASTVAFEVPRLVAVAADAPVTVAPLLETDEPPPPPLVVARGVAQSPAPTRGGPFVLMGASAAVLAAGLAGLAWSYSAYGRFEQQQPGGPAFGAPTVTRGQFQTLQWMIPASWVVAALGALGLAGGSTWLAAR
jgi:hypothetical protein